MLLGIDSLGCGQLSGFLILPGLTMAAGSWQTGWGAGWSRSDVVWGDEVRVCIQVSSIQ